MIKLLCASLLQLVVGTVSTFINDEILQFRIGGDFYGGVGSLAVAH